MLICGVIICTFLGSFQDTGFFSGTALFENSVSAKDFRILPLL